ncbi:MAG: fibronectin type III domain-containing protein, partial [Ilumatobacteraceae bacterium]
MRLSRNFRQARRFVLAGAIAGMTLFGSAHDAQALGTVTFAGASQVAYAQTTWTVSFKTANNANAVLAAGDTVTAVFDSAFTGIPATPTIALTAGFASCTATGSTTGSTVTVTLAGASCGLAKNTTGKFTIAGIVNPINAVYAAANFTVNTSQETTPVADGASETISAPTKTISSITPNLGTTAGGTSVTISGTTLGSTTLVTFGGVAGTSLVNVNATTVTVTTPAGTAGAVDVILSSTTGGVRSAGGFTYATTPSAPTISAITPSSGSLSVAFTAGATGGSAITSYKYSTDGGSTFRTRAAGTTASPLVISTLSTDGSTALVNGTSYNIQIKAVNAIGDGTASSTTAATPATTPSAPTITTITPSDGTLSVAFTAGATGGSAITTYKYSTDGGSTFRTRAAGTTASPLVISTLSTDGTTALVNGTSYNIQIKAVNAIGDGTASSTTAATPATTPSAPTITAITPSNGTLSVAFTAGATGGSAITTYKYSTDGGSTFFTRAAGTTASPLVITTLSTDGSTALVNGTSYNVQIKAVNAIGDGTASSTTAATPATTPSAPTITTITPSNGSLSVAFTAGANGGAAITSYKYSTDGGSTFRTRAAGTTSSPLVISTLSTDGTTALVNGTSYNIQIKAVNTAGDGTASSTTAATPATVPDAPTSLSGTAGNAQVVLTWTAPGSNGGAAITDYLVEFNDGNSWATFTDAVTATTGATVTGLANGTSYTFRVSAINSIGTGATATSSAVTPRTTPSAPTITAITPSNGSLSVAFTAGADGGSALTSYKYSTDGGSTFRTRAAGTTTSPLVISTASVDGSTALVNGTSYDIQIKAVNAAGDGTATATTAATPATTPSAPTITAITPSNGSLSVAFTAGATGGSAITSYKYSTDGGSTFRTRAAGTTASPIVISTASVDGSTALVNGTSYDIQIKAVNAIGDGTATATTAATPATTPSAPTITTITPSNGSLSVAFTAGATGGSAITTYEYSTNGGTNFQTRASGTTASPLVITTSSVDGSTALVNGTSYNIQIRAVNAIGSGTATSTTAATPATTPSAPTITTITPSNGSLSVAFTAGAT